MHQPPKQKLNPSSDRSPLSPGWVILGGLWIVLSLSSCAPYHAQRANVEVVYPHECITSDIVCHPHGKKEMKCDFQKLKACSVLKVVK